MRKDEDIAITQNSKQERWRQVQDATGILGESDKIRSLLETIEQVAQTDISVLITGESGTGKELVAKAIHMRSRRKEKSLVTVNCGAIPEGILESELFGHEKGSFTGAVGIRKGYFEMADKGSIFLDEIGELPIVTQVKLLRVLEAREFMRVGGTTLQQVDVRVIAATNKDLEREVKKDNFRDDLFYRLNAVHIHVPGLRERREDVPILVYKFANDFCRENHIEFAGFTEGAMHVLQQYGWPGNIRELRNIVEKVIVLERGNEVNEEVLKKYLRGYGDVDHKLPVPVKMPKEDAERELLFRVLLEIKSEIVQLRELLLMQRPPHYSLVPWRDEQSIDFQEQTADDSAAVRSKRKSVADMEKDFIAETLIKTGGNKRKAAKMLGLSERTLYRKIKKYGLRIDDDE